MSTSSLKVGGCLSGVVLLESILGPYCAAQETPPPPTREETALAQARAQVPSRYNITWGSGGIRLDGQLQGIYVDNVYLTSSGKRDDFIVFPQIDAGCFFPIGQLNSLNFDVGVGYYQYCKNTSLNSGTPTISPNSDLEFNLYTGDFHIKFSEVFSYQETPFYETGGQFFNVYHTGRFARFDNLVGVSAQWDLHDLAVTAGYHHEDLLSNGSTYNIIDRHSEIFNADAFLQVQPYLAVGMEAAASLNNFDNVQYNDDWRVGLGPAAKWEITRFLHARAGAGYERIQYDSNLDSIYGLEGFNDFYAYGELQHELNRFFRHTLRISHDNQIGVNAANLQGDHINYSISWNGVRRLTVSPYCQFNHYEESYGPNVSGLYREVFRYVSAGVGLAYTPGQNWRLGLNYDFRLKDSDTDNLSYNQNLVTLSVLYHF